MSLKLREDLYLMSLYNFIILDSGQFNEDEYNIFKADLVNKLIYIVIGIVNWSQTMCIHRIHIIKSILNSLNTREKNSEQVCIYLIETFCLLTYLYIYNIMR